MIIFNIYYSSSIWILILLIDECAKWLKIKKNCNPEEQNHNGNLVKGRILGSLRAEIGPWDGGLIPLLKTMKIGRWNALFGILRKMNFPPQNNLRLRLLMYCYLQFYIQICKNKNSTKVSEFSISGRGLSAPVSLKIYMRTQISKDLSARRLECVYKKRLSAVIFPH